jgi:hypothetical protein
MDLNDIKARIETVANELGKPALEEAAKSSSPQKIGETVLREITATRKNILTMVSKAEDKDDIVSNAEELLASAQYLRILQGFAENLRTLPGMSQLGADEKSVELSQVAQAAR